MKIFPRQGTELDDLDGFTQKWLAACAIFPDLIFPLTIQIGRALAKAEGQASFSESQMLDLFRLSWFRRGYIDEDTRLWFLRHLPTSDSALIRETINEVLGQTSEAYTKDAEDDSIENSLRDSLKYEWVSPKIFRQDRTNTDPANDIILMQFLNGESVRPGAMALHDSISNIFGERVANLFRPRFIALVLSTVLFGLAWAILPNWIPAFFEKQGHLEQALMYKYDEFEANNGPIKDLVFNAVGDKIVTVTETDGANIATVWTVANGTLLAALSGHTETINSIEFTPTYNTNEPSALDEIVPRIADDTYATFASDEIVTASSDNTARLWNAQTGEVIFVLAGHTDSVNSAAFSPNGQLIVTASLDKTVRLWQVRTGQEIAVFSDHDRGVLSARFSPDGFYIVTASADGTARIWDFQGDRVLAVLEDHTDGVNYAEFSPDGNYVVTASSDGTARIWNVQTGSKEVLILEGSAGFDAKFSPNNEYVATQSWVSSQIWDAQSGKLKFTVKGGWSSGTTHDFSPDGGKILIASGGAIELWDVTHGNKLFDSAEGLNNSGSLDLLNPKFSPSGDKVALSTTSGTIELWAGGIATPRIHVDLTRQTHKELDNDGVVAIAVSPSGEFILSVVFDGFPPTARVSNTGNAEKVFEFLPNPDWWDYLNFPSFSPQGTELATPTADGKISIYDVRSGRLVRSISTNQGNIHFVAYSADGSQLLSGGGDKTAQILDVENGNVIWEAKTASRTQWASLETAIEIPAKLTRSNAHDSGVIRGVFSKDGRKIATVTPNFIYLWDLEADGQTARRRELSSEVQGIKFSPDGEKIVILTGGEVSILDGNDLSWLVSLKTRRSLMSDKIFVFREPIYSVDFSPDGKHVLATGDTAIGNLWNVEFLDKYDGNQVRASLDDIVPVSILRGSRRHIVGFGSFDKSGKIILITGGRNPAIGDESANSGEADLPIEPTYSIWDIHDYVKSPTVSSLIDPEIAFENAEEEADYIARTQLCDEQYRQEIIYFEYDKTVSEESRNTTDRVLDVGEYCEVLSVRVVGHTDTDGSATYNLEKSLRMANSVTTELVRQGVRAESIRTEGKGETALFIETEDGVREQLNRRVEVLMTLGTKTPAAN